MPKLSLPLKENFITYYNIEKTYPKLEKILNKFHFTKFENYIKDSDSRKFF